MTPYNIAITVTIFISLIFVSCSPAPVFRLSPEAEHTTYYYGSEYVQSDIDDILVSLAYFRHTGDKIAFDVEIINYSEQPIRIAPEKFYTTAYNGPPGDRYTTAILQVNAVDPEKMLLEIDKKQSREKASEQTNLVLHATGEVLSLAGELASIGTDKSVAERESARLDRIERRAIRTDQRYQYEAAMHSLSAQRQSWEYDTLRKTDLLPDHHMRGLVYVPGKPEARYFMLVIPVGETEHRFVFRQDKFDANR
jgi:hypothetical protein